LEQLGATGRRERMDEINPGLGGQQAREQRRGRGTGPRFEWDGLDVETGDGCGRAGDTRCRGRRESSSRR
jgi:hypothetical protein